MKKTALFLVCFALLVGCKSAVVTPEGTDATNTGTFSDPQGNSTVTITADDLPAVEVPIELRVIDWTLADPITRVVVEVGIAYASDVERAHKVMEETLRSLPLVLDEPGPQVFFLGFGDSSLNFRLHAFSRQLSDRLLKVALEEVAHYVTGATDNSRDFQDYLLDLAVKLSRVRVAAVV